MRTKDEGKGGAGAVTHPTCRHTQMREHRGGERRGNQAARHGDRVLTGLVAIAERGKNEVVCVSGVWDRLLL